MSCAVWGAAPQFRAEFPMFHTNEAGLIIFQKRDGTSAEIVQPELKEKGEGIEAGLHGSRKERHMAVARYHRQCQACIPQFIIGLMRTGDGRPA